MITRKNLAPLDDTLREFWRSKLKYLKNKTLWSLYLSCQDFFAYCCISGYVGCTCDDCEHQKDCLRCKITMEEVKHELTRRRFIK